MDHKLLDILVCPICKGRLQFNAEKNGLICRAEKLIYPIEDGIPLMLESLAQPFSEPTGNAPGVI
jgi:uncharacterized protein YbaR (Trm112 family)